MAEMRLIDADALKTKIEQSDGEGTIARYCKRVLAERLDNDAPTIDAIPVEWIMKWSNKRYRETHRDVSIVDVLEAWQKEQEAKT